MAPKKATRYGMFQYKHEHTENCESCQDLQDSLDLIERECLHDGVAAGTPEEMYAEMDVIKRSLAVLYEMGRPTKLSVPCMLTLEIGYQADMIGIGHTIRLCTSTIQRPGFSLRTPMKTESRSAEHVAIIDKLERANKAGAEVSLSVHELMLIRELSKNWPMAKHTKQSAPLSVIKTQRGAPNIHDRQIPADLITSVSAEELEVVQTSFRNWWKGLSPDITLTGLLITDGIVNHKKPDPVIITDILRSMVGRLKHTMDGCDCEQLDAKESAAALEIINAFLSQMQVISSQILEVQNLLDTSIKTRVTTLEAFHKALSEVGHGGIGVHRRMLYNQQIYLEIIVAKTEELCLRNANLGRKVDQMEAEVKSRNLLDSSGIDRFVQGALSTLSSRYIPGVSGLDDVQDHLVKLVEEYSSQFVELERLKGKTSDAKVETTKELDRLRSSLRMMTRRADNLTAKQNAWAEKEKAKEALVLKQIAAKNKTLAESENSIRLIRDSDGLRQEEHRKAVEKLEEQIAAKDDEICRAKRDATAVAEKVSKRLKSLHQISMETKQELEALHSSATIVELDLEATQEALDAEKAKTGTLEGLLKDRAPKDAEIAALTLENKGLLAKLRTNDVVEADKLKSMTAPLKTEVAKLKSEVLHLREQKVRDDEYLREVLRERTEDKVGLDHKTEALNVLENLLREERGKTAFLLNSIGTPYL